MADDNEDGPIGFLDIDQEKLGGENHTPEEMAFVVLEAVKTLFKGIEDKQLCSRCLTVETMALLLASECARSEANTEVMIKILSSVGSRSMVILQGAVDVPGPGSTKVH